MIKRETIIKKSLIMALGILMLFAGSGCDLFKNQEYEDIVSESTYETAEPEASENVSDEPENAEAKISEEVLKTVSFNKEKAF